MSRLLRRYHCHRRCPPRREVPQGPPAARPELGTRPPRAAPRIPASGHASVSSVLPWAPTLAWAVPAAGAEGRRSLPAGAPTREHRSARVSSAATRTTLPTRPAAPERRPRRYPLSSRELRHPPAGLPLL